MEIVIHGTHTVMQKANPYIHTDIHICGKGIVFVNLVHIMQLWLINEA